MLNASKKIPIESLFTHKIDSELVESFYYKNNTVNPEMLKEKK